MLFPAIVVGIVLLWLLFGCGGESNLSSEDAEPVRSRWLNHGTKLVTISVDGTEMLCIERRSNSDQSYGGQYAGLTCDWVGWHAKREEP